MPGGIITDTLQDIGYNVWLVGSALSIVSAVMTVRSLAIEGYEVLLRSNNRSVDRWKALISLYTVFMLILAVTIIGSLRIVLNNTWVEQITSALVVGIGFGMQGLILDTVWGYIRRTHAFIMDNNSTLEVVFNRQLIKGRIVNMFMTSFVLESNGDHYVIGWSNLREFKLCKSHTNEKLTFPHQHNQLAKRQ